MKYSVNSAWENDEGYKCCFYTIRMLHERMRVMVFL